MSQEALNRLSQARDKVLRANYDALVCPVARCMIDMAFALMPEKAGELGELSAELMGMLQNAARNEVQCNLVRIFVEHNWKT